jgi:hypothetical protein
MMQQGNVRVVRLNVTLDELSTEFGLRECEYCPGLAKLGEISDLQRAVCGSYHGRCEIERQ